MKLTFVSGTAYVTCGFKIDSQDAVTELTKIEKQLGKDLTDIIQKVIDVAFNVTAQTFTRGPKDAYVVSYSWEFHPVHEEAVIRSHANAAKSITVAVGDSDHDTYEFEDVEERDIDAMITWLRKEHQVYYTPNDELRNEKKKVEDLKKQLAATDTQILELNKLNVALYKDKKDLFKFRSDIMEALGLCFDFKSFDENSKKAIEAIKALREFRKEVIKRAGVDESESSDNHILRSLDIKLDHSVADRFINKVYELANCGRYTYTLDEVLDELERKLKANDFRIEADWEADYRAFVQRIFEAVGTPCVDEVIHTNYLAAQALEAVKGLKAELADDLERLDELEDFRSDICGVLDIDSDELFGSQRQNDKYILDQVERIKKIEHEHYHVINNWYKESYLKELLNDLCDENKVFRPNEIRSYKECLDYIFEVLANWRGRAVRAEHDLDECIKANTKDYTNAKCARAELANLYKRILGEERLDPKLSPHEVAVAIIKHVQGLCDLQHEANMSVKELQKFRDEVHDILKIGYPTTNKHILTVLRTRQEKLDADGPWVTEQYITELIRENSTKFKVLQPLNYMTIEERMRYVFVILNEWRDKARKAEDEVKDLNKQNDRGTAYVKRMRELEQKLEDIKNICDGDSDIMNIIGE